MKQIILTFEDDNNLHRAIPIIEDELALRGIDYDLKVKELK